MAKPEEIRSEELRALFEQAHDEIRTERPSDAVRTLSRTYLRMLELEPEMLKRTIEFRRGMKVLAVMRWPALGANLDLASVRAGKPRIEFLRERFALSEAMTYYEYTLDSALAEGL